MQREACNPDFIRAEQRQRLEESIELRSHPRYWVMPQNVFADWRQELIDLDGLTDDQLIEKYHWSCRCSARPATRTSSGQSSGSG